MVRVHMQIGNRKALYAGASGKLLAAYADAEVQAAVLEGTKEKFTPNTIVERQSLEQQFDQIRSAGYSISYAERTAEAIAVAVPVRDARGTVVAALSIAVPASRASKMQLNAFLGTLQKEALEFSRELGFVESVIAR